MRLEFRRAHTGPRASTGPPGVGRDQPAALAHERPRQPVGRVVGLPAVEVLGIQAAAIDAIRGASTHASDPAVMDGDIDPVAVGVQDRGRRDPAVDVGRLETGLQMDVDARGPAVSTSVRRALAPRLLDAIDHIAGLPAEGRAPARAIEVTRTPTYVP
jgi:hypothetical protein